MIELTRLNATRITLNADLIERVQESPDTVVVMANGATYVVRESMAEVIELSAAYRARVITLARFGAPTLATATSTTAQRQGD